MAVGVMAVALEPLTLNDLLERDRQDAWQHFDRLAGIYATELRRLARDAVKPLHRAQWSRLTAAGTPADWTIPDPDELINAVKAAGELAGKTRAVREQIAETAVGGTLAAYGIQFNLKNPLIQNVLNQMGQHITQIVEAQRGVIMQSLSDAWNEGLSIGEAAKKMVRDSVIDSKARGELIARTELTGATNGGSLAAVRLVNDATPADSQLRKIWIATNDDRTRDSHAQASDDYGEGSGIPVDQPFNIGGADMQHPGDPTGPPEEVINCRCLPGQQPVSGAVVHAAMRRPFEGHVVRVRTASGHDITATPNHPVLTVAGWRSVSEIQKGDDLVCGRDRQATGAGDPHVGDHPTTAEQVFQALTLAGARPDRIGTVDLHGESPDGEVDVVLTDDALSLDVDAVPLAQHFRQLSLALAHREMRAARHHAALDGIGHSENRGRVAVARGPARFAEDHIDRRAHQAGCPSDGGGRFTGVEQLDDVGAVAVASACPARSVPNGSGPGREPGLPEAVLDRADGESDLVADLLVRHPGLVHADQVVRVDCFAVPATHVYNLSSSTGCYIAGGIITANCAIGYEQVGGAEPVAPAEPAVTEPVAAEPPATEPLTVPEMPWPPPEVPRPVLYGDWAGHADAIRVARTAADDLTSRYRIDLRGVRVSKDVEDVGQLAGRDRYTVRVSPKFLDDKFMAKREREFRGLTVGTDRRSIIVHETGHIIDSTLQRDAPDAFKAIHDYVREPVTYKVGEEDVTVPRWRAGNGTAPSPYAQESPFEYVAEAFDDWFTNGEQAAATSQHIGKIIDQALAKPAERSATSMAKDLITTASREEPQVTHDLSTIVRSEGGEMGGLKFRLKTEKSLAGKLERKAAEKGITPEAYSKSVADVLRYTGVFKPEDYARGVEQTIERLRSAGYKISDSDVENYWATGDDYNGINATAVTPSGYRFELQFHTQESLDLKNGELHKLYEQFRDEQNPHERYRLWTRMVDLSNSISQPDEAVLRIGTRTVHKPPALPETPEELARSLIESAQRRETLITADVSGAVGANLGKMEGLEFRLKSEASLVRKLMAKGPLDPVAYSQKVADVLRYTGTFAPDEYDLGVRGAIDALRENGYQIDESDIENYWQPGDDYNGINITVRTRDGYRFELQFHTPESFALKNGELHRLYEEYRVSTDPFIRRQLWDQMVNLSDNLQTRMDLNVIMNVRKIGTLAAHEPPIAATLDEIDAVTHFDKYLRGDAAEALDRYTGIAYDDINAYLRTGDLKINRHTGEYEYLGTMPEFTSAEAKATRLRQVEAWINNMKDTFLPAEKPFLAYRGFRKAVLTDKYGANANLKNLIGKTITDKGFVSVSADQRIAEGFGSSEESVVMELAVPKDMPTLNVNRSGSGNTFEQEVLLPPGSRFVVQSVRQPRRPGPYIVRAIVEPPDG
jgi:ppGpp synthetase/RelA/SpoT-type nucleotidyltranferase